MEEVADRLSGISRHQAAAELYKDIDEFKKAIDCYIFAKAWEKARAVTNMAPAYRDYVDKAYCPSSEE